MNDILVKTTYNPSNSPTNLKVVFNSKKKSLVTALFKKKHYYILIEILFWFRRTKKKTATVFGMLWRSSFWLFYWRTHRFTIKKSYKGFFLLSMFFKHRKNLYLTMLSQPYQPDLTVSAKQRFTYLSSGVLLKEAGVTKLNMRRRKKGRVAIIAVLRRRLIIARIFPKNFIVRFEGLSSRTFGYWRLLKKLFSLLRINKIYLKTNLSFTTDRMRRIKSIKRRIRKRIIKFSPRK